MMSARLDERTEKIRITPEIIDGYLRTLAEKGRSPSSLQNYRGMLMKLHDYLPKDKELDERRSASWIESLERQGYYARTINVHLSVLNGFLVYLGRGGWQLKSYIRELNEVQPELTRSEYMRLLRTARRLGKERSYLLIKTLGGAGVRMQELSQITVEALFQEAVPLRCHNGRRMLYLPESLKEELRDYVRREGIKEGPVFATQEGAPLARASVWHLINSVSQEAQVSGKKANPRCLWKMYQSTYAGIESNIQSLVAQAYNRMLEEEQLAIGWKI